MFSVFFLFLVFRHTHVLFLAAFKEKENILINFFFGKCLGNMFRNSFESQTFVVCLFYIIVYDFAICHIHLKEKSLMDSVFFCLFTPWHPQS